MTLDPPPCVALRVRDSAGPWQLALIALHCRSPPKVLQEAAYTPKAISDRLGKGVDSSLTNGSRLYTCESKYRQAYTLRTEHYNKSTAELPLTPNLLPLTGFGMVWPSNDYILVPRRREWCH